MKDRKKAIIYNRQLIIINCLKTKLEFSRIIK